MCLEPTPRHQLVKLQYQVFSKEKLNRHLCLVGRNKHPDCFSNIYIFVWGSDLITIWAGDQMK